VPIGIRPVRQAVDECRGGVEGWRHPIEERAMTDPRESTERHDPNRFTPDLGEPDRGDGTQRNEADRLEADAEKRPPAEGDDLGSDANELDADNPVEQDSIETLDPENPPA
jgi:hypothetical protein